MKKLNFVIKKLGLNSQGAAAIEYAVMAAILGAMLIIAIPAFETAVSGVYDIIVAFF